MARPADWSSLLPELVNRVGDVFLTTGDIDYYMRFRAVCSSWRAATDDPRGPSQRFRPCQWVMLEDLSSSADSRLFLNIDTGRFLWKELPLLNNRYTYVGADNGLLVLQLQVMDMPRYDICILNPFTGFMVRFPTSHGSHLICSRIAMSGDMTSPQLFLFLHGDLVCCDPSDPSMQWFKDDPSFRKKLTTIVSFQGRAYGANMCGPVMVVGHFDGHITPEITTIIHTNGKIGESFLVDNDGELLLVRVPYEYPWRMHVFKVDLEVKTLIPIKSIGNRAIFIGHRSCLSFNADLLHGIEANGIYSFQQDIDVSRLYRWHLSDGSQEVLAVRSLWRYYPLSLAQIIMEHCTGD